MRAKSKIILGIVLAVLMNYSGFSQEGEKITIDQKQLAAIQTNEAELEVWFEALRTPGVRVEGNTMYFSEEAQRLIKDIEYRNSIYKTEYTFNDVKESLEQLSMQQAFYRMLVMYPEHKEEVVAYIYAYDRVFPTDEVVISSFYTYAFFDPSITKISEGKPEIIRPDIFEEYLRRSREIISYIHYFRNKEKEQKL